MNANEASGFFDQDIVRIFDHYKQHLVEPLPRSIPVNELNKEQKLQVFSYFRLNMESSGEKLRSALVINVKVKNLFNTLSSYSQAGSQSATRIMLLDPDGVVIADSAETDFLNDLSATDYVQKVRAAGKPSGYTLSKINDQRVVVTYVSNPRSSWTMMNITPYKDIAVSVNKVRNITLIIGAAMLLFCIATGFLLAQNLYKPIRRLRLKAHQISGSHEETTAGGDLEFISDLLTSLQTFKKTNLNTLKQNLLIDILHHKIPDHFEDLFAEYKITLEPHNRMIMVMLQIDQYAQFHEKYNKKDQALIKYAISNIAEEFAPNGACVDMGEDHVVLLMKGSEEEYPEIQSLLKEIQSSCFKYCRISLSIYISSSINTIREAAGLYEDMRMFSRNRIRAGHGCILIAAAEDPVSKEMYKPDGSLLIKFTQSIHQGRVEAMNRIYAEIIQPLRLRSYNEIWYTLSILSINTFQTISAMERNSTLNFDLDYIQFDQRIKQLETLDEINQAFGELFQAIAAVIQQNKDERTIQTVDKAKQFIQDHYMDKALSSYQVADHVHITSAYLGKLFREQLTHSIAEYITRIRMEHACQLLMETSDTIDEIVEQIGWENKNYFYTVFKKQFGASPTEYRMKMSRGE